MGEAGEGNHPEVNCENEGFGSRAVAAVTGAF